MFKNRTSESQPAGLALFTDAETFLVDLSEDDESMITGGANSVSNIRGRRRRQLAVRRQRLLAARRRRQAPRPRRRRRIVARRSISSRS